MPIFPYFNCSCVLCLLRFPLSSSLLHAANSHGHNYYSGCCCRCHCRCCRCHWCCHYCRYGRYFSVLLPPWSSSFAKAALFFTFFFAFFFACYFLRCLRSFLLSFAFRRSRSSILLLMCSICRINVMVMVAASPAVPLEEGGQFCSSINLTIAPTIDVRSLFLFDKFFVLLALIILPAFVRASRTCMGVGVSCPPRFG